VTAPPVHRYDAIKRSFDILAVLLSLPVVLPVLAVVAVAVRLDSPGPVLFRQARTGLHGRRFPMLKFRTMVVDAEERKAELAHLNELPWPDFKITNDPRITRVGGFLRKTSLDELPQLLNVLRGDMSIVGPRPTSFSANTYDLWHTARLEVRPGLTGLWQVAARNDVDFDERLRLDIAYVRAMSPAMDARIIARTFLSVLRGSGA
jgi:lipopolysaccharide/colanic/teichoic acid biosynthesis glycosyltransferase